MMADHEEHILYLMIELDQALARKTPQWVPEQMDVARRPIGEVTVDHPAVMLARPAKWISEDGAQALWMGTHQR